MKTEISASMLAGVLLSGCGVSGPGAVPSMQVESAGTPIAGTETKLTIRLKDGEGRPIDRLDVVHEKKLHFLIMSRDLAFFAHEHPGQKEDGSLALDFTFPGAGEYILFADYTPTGGRGTVSSTRLRVQGRGDMSEPALEKDDLSRAKRSGSYDVKLDLAAHGTESMLTFTITRQGRPVADLRPYLGALGHLVLVDPAATRLLHSHPMGAGDPGKVSFHTTFPAPGLYKLWAEFRPGGESLRVDFVIEVPESKGGPHAH